MRLTETLTKFALFNLCKYGKAETGKNQESKIYCMSLVLFVTSTGICYVYVEYSS